MLSCYWAATALQFRDRVIDSVMEKGGDTHGIRSMLQPYIEDATERVGARSQERRTPVEDFVHNVDEKLHDVLSNKNVKIEPDRSAVVNWLRSIPSEKSERENAIVGLASVLRSGGVSGFSSKEIGLIIYDDNHGIEYLANSDKTTPMFSSRRVPFQIVSWGAPQDLGRPVATDLVLSRLVELIVWNQIDASGKFFEQHSLSHIYFVALTGSLSAIGDSKNAPPGIEDASTPAWKMFSDTPYMRETVSVNQEHDQANSQIKNKRCRWGEPYIDSAGHGIVETYSLYVDHFEDFPTAGLLCVDRRLLRPDDIWGNIKFGAEIRDTENGLIDIQKKFASPGFEDVYDAISTEPRLFRGGIKKVALSGDRSAFAVSLGDDKYGCLIFGGARARKYWIMGSVAVGSLVFLAGLLIWSIRLRRTALHARADRSEIAEKIHCGLALLREDGRVVDANSKMIDLVGKKKGGKNSYIDKVMTERTRAMYKRRIGTESGGFEFPGEIETEDGKIEPVIVGSAPLAPGGSAAQMLILIPSRDLEANIASKFVHVISHALKTPLQGILFLAERMRKKTAQEKWDRYLALLRRQTAELEELVGNVLAFSSVDENVVELNFDSFSLTNAIRATAEAVSVAPKES